MEQIKIIEDEIKLLQERKAKIVKESNEDRYKKSLLKIQGLISNGKIYLMDNCLGTRRFMKILSINKNNKHVKVKMLRVYLHNNKLQYYSSFTLSEENIDITYITDNSKFLSEAEYEKILEFKIKSESEIDKLSAEIVSILREIDDFHDK